MSKIDELLATVDTLTAQSDLIVSSVADSNMLISLILQVNSSIATVDSQIDSMTGLINKNNVCLNELEKLYEKSYYLETNLNTNDVYVSEASLDCLAKEYEYVLSSLSFESVVKLPLQIPRRVNLQPLVANLQPSAPLQLADTPPTDSGTQHQALQSKLSLSNLALKPLRCKQARVLKQKSRYRLSAAYTLNPVQEVRNVLSSSRDTYESSVMDHFSINESSMSAEEEEVERSLGNVAKGPGTAHSSDSSARKLSRSETIPSRSDIAPLRYGMSPLHYEMTPLHDGLSHAQPNPERHRPQTTPRAHPNMSPAPKTVAVAVSPAGFGALDAFALEQLDEYNVSLLTSPGSLLSLDNSRGSPPRLDEIDNFHRYLRQSRVDLQAAIQHLPLLRSLSHESVFFDAAHQEPIETPQLAPPRFHNPTDFIKSAAPKSAPVLPPTVETVYLNSFDPLLAPEDSTCRDFKTLSRKLLCPDAPVTPLKSNFGLFTYLSSPTRGAVAHVTNENHGRRGSTDLLSKSLALSFRNLVSIKSDVLPARKTKLSPPEKIKQMRRGMREPIAAHSDVVTKRLPPQGLERQLRNGRHSSLTIGPNKTKIVNHGQELIFKKPTVRRRSLSLIREALNDSIFL